MEIVYIVAILAGSIVGISAMRLGFKPRIAAKTRYGDSIVIEASIPDNQTVQPPPLKRIREERPKCGGQKRGKVQ